MCHRPTVFEVAPGSATSPIGGRIGSIKLESKRRLRIQPKTPKIGQVVPVHTRVFRTRRDRSQTERHILEGPEQPLKPGMYLPKSEAVWVRYDLMEQLPRLGENELGLTLLKRNPDLTPESVKLDRGIVRLRIWRSVTWN